MNPQNYFQAYENYFWQWEDQGNALAIPNAFTISFKEYLQEVMSNLAPQGLPPFGSLLLTILATNTNGATAIDAVYSLIKITLNNADNLVLTEAINFLKLLSEVPSELKTGKKRLLLLQSIFQVCHNQTNKKDSKDLVKALQNSRATFFSNKTLFNFTIFHKDFQAVGLLNRKLKTVSDIVNSMTGLPEINEDLSELVQEQHELSDNIIDQLINEKQTFFVGSLIKRLWASLNIPFHHQIPSQQTFGGIADITNKGDLDKLLISEFANDNDLFLTRLANNEVLFYNREVPPTRNDFQRIILIDASLKNWGTIKTISFAISIAIATHPKSKIECLPFVISDSFQPVSIDSVGGIIDSLSILGTNLHSANGLQLFFENTDLAEKEIILVANQESLAFSEIEKIIREFKNPIDYWIHPTANGQVTIFKKQSKSKKQIQFFDLPLKDIWRNKKFNSNNSPEHKNYPILFHEPLTYKKAIFLESAGLFKVTKEKALFRLYDKHSPAGLKGWELYYENLAYLYDEYALGMSEKNILVLLMFTSKYKEVALLTLSTGEMKKIPFPYSQNSPYKKFFFDNNLFYFIHSNFYITIDLDGNLSKYEEVPRHLIKNYNEISQVVKRELGGTPQKRQIFKNLKSPFINEESELIFNNQRLHFTAQNTIQIGATKMLKRTFEAKYTGRSTYTFADGSKIQMKQTGMIILISSDENLPTIYIPSIIGHPLGVATDDFFAGNEYYFISSKYELLLLEKNDKAIEIIKAIRASLNIGLKEAKKIVDNCPSIICKDFNNTKAFNLKKELEAQGAIVTMKAIGSKQTQIETKEFYRNYIKAYIEKIIRHGN